MIETSETSIIDQLYLELSWISKAETAKEHAYRRQVEVYEQALNKIAYHSATDAIGTAHSALSVFGKQS